MDWYEADIRELERRRRDAPPAPGAVAFYGSSSFTLWASLADDFPRVAVQNLAFGGSTLAACAHFYQRVVPPVRPRALVLYAGDNDLGDGQSPEAVAGSFAWLQRQHLTSCPTAPLAFVSIKPSPSRWHLRDRIAASNELIRGLVLSQPGGLFVNVHSQMIRDGQPRRELFADDGLHLSRAGYDLWVRVLREQAGHLVELCDG